MIKNKTTWAKTRKLFNDIHLWLGLISGIIIFFICLSGTIYVFNTELREWASPQLYQIKASEQSKKLSAEQLMLNVQKEFSGKISTVKIPFHPNRSYTITLKKEEPSEDKKTENDHHNKKTEDLSKAGKDKKAPQGGHGGRGTPYMVNPYTGELLGTTQGLKSFTAEFMQLMFSLHRWLLLDKVEEPIIGDLENRKLGSYISGTATILFTFGVITGIVIWFPKKVKNWRQGLKIKTSGNWKRLNHDLHNSLGLYSCILLLLMGLTGPQWSFPWYREGLRKSLGTYQPEGGEKKESPKSVKQAGQVNNLTIADYLAIAGKQLPYNGDYTISLPTDSTDVVNISKNKVGFFAPVAADKIILDQYSGEVLMIDIFKEKPFNERVSASIKALHTGEVYGSFTKILYFIACLIATSLPVTGTLIWINKLKQKRRKKIKQAKKVSQPIHAA